MSIFDRNEENYLKQLNNPIKFSEDKYMQELNYPLLTAEHKRLARLNNPIAFMNEESNRHRSVGSNFDFFSLVIIGGLIYMVFKLFGVLVVLIQSVGLY